MINISYGNFSWTVVVFVYKSDKWSDCNHMIYLFLCCVEMCVIDSLSKHTIGLNYISNIITLYSGIIFDDHMYMLNIWRRRLLTK